MECPINKPEGECQDCPYSKEGLCDYPYRVCPGKEKCEKIAAVLDQQFEVPAMYPLLINKTCLECDAYFPPICISKVGY